MDDLKEILKTAIANGPAIGESIKGSFNKFAIDKDANFIIIQLDTDKEIRCFYSGEDGTAEPDDQNKLEYIKAFLPGIEMLLMMQDMSETDTGEFFDMMQNILKESFEKSEFHTIAYARHKKQFYSTTGEQWEEIKIENFIDLNSFIEVIEKTI
jgi:hypothetical protein